MYGTCAICSIKLMILRGRLVFSTRKQKLSLPTNRRNLDRDLFLGQPKKHLTVPEKNAKPSVSHGTESESNDLDRSTSFIQHCVSFPRPASFFEKGNPEPKVVETTPGVPKKGGITESGINSWAIIQEKHLSKPMGKRKRLNLRLLNYKDVYVSFTFLKISFSNKYHFAFDSFNISHHKTLCFQRKRFRGPSSPPHSSLLHSLSSSWNPEKVEKAAKSKGKA